MLLVSGAPAVLAPVIRKVMKNVSISHGAGLRAEHPMSVSWPPGGGHWLLVGGGVALLPPALSAHQPPPAAVSCIVVAGMVLRLS